VPVEKLFPIAFRLIKNREYAQKGRDKQKERIKELELKVSELTQENKALQVENKTLKYHLAKVLRGDSDSLALKYKR
jgi:regulator of replication initiation timing